MRQVGTCRRDAFATVAAVVLTGLVSVALLATVTLLRNDALRTRRAVAEAQLRQLLLAGQVAASAALTDNENERRVLKIDLPEELTASSSLTLVLDPANQPDLLTATLEAGHDGFYQSQALTYRRVDGRWALAEAQLAGPPRRVSLLPEEPPP